MIVRCLESLIVATIATQFEYPFPAITDCLKSYSSFADNGSLRLNFPRLVLALFLVFRLSC